MIVTPDGRHLICGSDDMTLRVVDLQRNEEIAQLTIRGSINACAIAPDGLTCFVGTKGGGIHSLYLENVIPGAPIVTAQRGQTQGLMIRCQRCMSKLNIEPSKLGSIIDCPECGATLRVNPFTLDRLVPFPSFSAPTLMRLTGHKSDVLAVAVTPDGHHFVSGSVDKSLKVWDLESGELLQTLEGHKNPVYTVSVTPDGRYGISGDGRLGIHDSSGGIIRVWDLQSGETLRTLEGHTGIVKSVTVTPDGRLAVSGSSDTTIKVWDLEGGEVLHTLKGHTKWVNAVAVTPDGRRAISGSSDTTIKVWDLESGEGLYTLEGHISLVYALAVTPDGKNLISGSNDNANDNTIKVWNLESGEELRSLAGHKGDVSAMALTPDGRHIISGSGGPGEENTIRMWDLESGTLLCTLEGHKGDVSAVAVTPDGTRAVSGSEDATLRVWDLESVDNFTTHALIVTARRTLSQKLGVRCPLCDISFEIKQPNLGCDIPCPDCGTPLRVNPFIVDVLETPPASRVSTSAKVVDRPELVTESRRLTGHQDDVLAISLTPDGKYAISGSSDNTLKVWDLQNGEVLRTLEGHLSLVGAVAVTPNGKRAVSGSRDHTIKVWNLQNGELLQTLKHTNSVNAVAVTPDGTHLVAGSGNKLRVWDLRSREKLFWGGYHLGTVTAVALTPDGTRAVSGSLDKTIRVWDMEYWDELHMLKGHKDRVTAVAVTPDSTRIVSASFDGTLKVWNLQTGELLRTLEGHTSHINAVVVTPDGACAISGSWDNTIRMWDIESGEYIRTHEGHTKAVWSVAVTSDGRRVLSGSRDKTLRVWDLPGREHQQTHEMRTSAVGDVQEDQKQQVSSTDEENMRAQADHLRRKGEQLLNSWELARAVDCFDQALDLLPDDLTLLDLKARTLLESGDIQGGLDIISYVRNKDLASKDYLGKLYGAVGFALGAIGGEAFEDALEYYQMASALVPGDWEIWYYQGLANYRMGYYEDALDCLQRAKEIDDNEETNSLIDSCYEEIEELNFDQSIIGERPADVIHLQPSPTSQTADDLYKKGSQLFNSGDFEGALDCFEAVLKQQPENPEALLMHLSTLLRLDRRQETIQAADQALENRLASGENLALVYYLKGCAQISLRQFEQGLESLGQSLKLDDENVAAWTIRAQAYSELKDYQAALECYLRVRELEWSEETEAMIGMYYLNLNDTEKAEATFKSMVEEGSTHPLSFFGYGLCLVMMDKPEQGCMWLRRFLDDPGDQYQELVSQAHQVVDKFS